MWVLLIVSIVIVFCSAVVYYTAHIYDTPYKTAISQISCTKLLLAFFSVYFFFIIAALGKPAIIDMNMIYLTGLVLCAFVIDSWFMVIPDRLLAIFIPGILFTQLINWEIMTGILGASFGFILLLTIAVISKGGIGGGDIKLVTVIGLGTSLEFIYQVLLIACSISFLIGIIALYTGIRKRNDMMPFGPAIAFSTILLLIL